MIIRNREDIKQAKRIVVKVGTSTITYANYSRNFTRIDHLARELSDLHNQGREIILVTSGAIAVGTDRLHLPAKPRTIPGKQAVAAVGQGILMNTYEKMFAEYGTTVAQVLLTRMEMRDRHHYINSRNTFMELLRMGVIPIVNENDTVALDDLKIGDNDNMSALVGGLADADLIIILSDIDGYYTANPATHPDAKLVHEVTEITPAIEAAAGDAGTTRGTGGMMTKIQAAKQAVSSGISLVIASGTEPNAIARILQGEELGTLFISRETACRSASAGSLSAPAARAASSWTTDASGPCSAKAAAASCRQASCGWKAPLRPATPSACAARTARNWPAA